MAGARLKTVVAKKAPVEQKSIIPKTVSASEFQEFGFYASNNCYYFADNKGVPDKLHSNFVLTPLFHIESTINAKRLYEVKNMNNQVRVIEILQRDWAEEVIFVTGARTVAQLGNFGFYGSQSDLNRLKRWLYEKTESCKEITQLGWQKEGFWAWGNGIFNSEYTPVDSYGIVKHGKRSYYIPAFSQNLREGRKPLPGGSANSYTWKATFHPERVFPWKFITVFGENARIALCFYFAPPFSATSWWPQVWHIPDLNKVGPAEGSRENSLCRRYCSVFRTAGQSAKRSQHFETGTGRSHCHIGKTCIAHIDEYRNDIEMEKREFLKGLWDGNGRSRMNMDKDKKREMTSVDQAVDIDRTTDGNS